MKIELDVDSREYLVSILEQRICEVTDLIELVKINKILKSMGHESKTWLEELS